MNETFDFEARAQFCGRLRWICPRCGKGNGDTLNLGTWNIRCTNKHCQQRYVIGLRFLVPRKHQRMKIPRDCVFPIFPVESWEPGTKTTVFEPPEAE